MEVSSITENDRAPTRSPPIEKYGKSKASTSSSDAIKRRSRNLTKCLLCLVAAIFSLTPNLSHHLTERVGLLLFEADLAQLRSSQVSSVIVCLFFLVMIISLVIQSNYCDRNQDNNIGQFLRKISEKLIPLAAIVSSLAYLSIVLLVPHIKQIQRLPLATFDCDANLITIENCHQSYTARGTQALRYILLGYSETVGDQDGGERLIKDLNCLRYTDESHKSVQVPTNFLLHSCGLVCRPQRQEYHQFGDDLNSSPNETKRNEDQSDQRATGQLSLKVCFSDEIGGSSYKQYCITNLAEQGQQQKGDTLTLGQLNALLRQKTATITRDTMRQDYDSTFNGLTDPLSPTPAAITTPNDDQATRYANPIVQFESHFKNWPYLSNSQQNLDSTSMNSMALDDEDKWCLFRPMPPFIVNNKPFSDIKCSIEHEYTMSTRSSQADRIYLRKSMPALEVIEKDVRSERCNIQCRVNILYQVRVEHQSRLHYYLPMKSCNIITGESNKATITRQYVIFRSIGDSALTICLILIDLMLLIESIDTKQFYLEQNKSRALGVLLVILLVPLLVTLQYDLIQSNDTETGFFKSFLTDYVLPFLHELKQRYKAATSSNLSETPERSNTQTMTTTFHFDSYLVPMFNFTIIMFIMLISSKNLHDTEAKSEPISLIRISSSEELGLIGTKPTSSQQNKAEDHSEGNLTTKLKRRQNTFEIFLFLLMVLFLGIQFHLSLTSQSFILRETFGSSPNGKKYLASWFEFSTNTGPTILVFILAFVFRCEMFAFLANFSPFKSSLADNLNSKKNRAKFLKYICLALTIYALRFFLLYNLNKESRMRFPMVFLFLLGELFNFPLVWFVLCRRAHELLIQQYPTWNRTTTTGSGDRMMRTAASVNGALGRHSIVQAGLAVAYFALARLVALTLHSLNVGLHLHSDNVDWFITSFQRQLLKADDSNNNNSSATSSSNNIADAESSLFSPLPSERQTYLHASRSFLKYNSLLCLFVAAISAANLLYFKYQIWLEQKRTFSLDHKVSLSARTDHNEDENDDFEQQLSRDLMQVCRESRPRVGPTSLIYPSDISNRSETSTSRADTPRAKVLFHYRVNRDMPADRNRSPSTPSVVSPTSKPSATFVRPPSRTTPSPVVRMISVDRDDTQTDSRRTSNRCSPINDETEVESTSKYRNKTIHFIEQDDHLGNASSPSRKLSESGIDGIDNLAKSGRKRTISFAPEATFIGGSGGGGSNGGVSRREHSKGFVARVNSTRTRVVRQASPESSIEGSELSD